MFKVEQILYINIIDIKHLYFHIKLIHEQDNGFQTIFNISI